MVWMISERHKIIFANVFKSCYRTKMPNHQNTSPVFSGLLTKLKTLLGITMVALGLQ